MRQYRQDDLLPELHKHFKCGGCGRTKYIPNGTNDAPLCTACPDNKSMRPDVSTQTAGELL